MTTDARYTRQMRLAEVGENGQRRLAMSEVRLAGEGTAAAIEARYLGGAGVSTTTSATSRSAGSPSTLPRPSPPLEPGPPWLASLSPAAREVASGAYAALTVVRAILADSPHPRVRTAR